MKTCRATVPCSKLTWVRSLPDVRQYLILIGSTPKTEEPVSRKRARLDQDEQEREALERGKALLLKAWKEGQGSVCPRTMRDMG